MDRKYDCFNMHRKIKEMTVRRGNKNVGSVIRDTEGRMIVDVERRLERWKEYVMALFNDDRPPRLILAGNDEKLVILRAELECALKTMKSDRAADPDQIPIELIKLLEGEAID